MRSKMSRGKLTDQQVRTIRKAVGWGALKAVCERLGVKPSVASKVRAMKIYAGVK